jgi:TPP-dependent pyruvate/acetoin dehydrogenase alpha subunit
LLDRKWATEAELKKLTEKGLTLIDEAVQALEQSGMPDPATVMNHAVAG